MIFELLAQIMFMDGTATVVTPVEWCPDQAIVAAYPPTVDDVDGLASVHKKREGHLNLYCGPLLFETEEACVDNMWFFSGQWIASDPAREAQAETVVRFSCRTKGALRGATVTTR